MVRLLAFLVSLSLASALIAADNRTPQLFDLDRSKAEELIAAGKYDAAIDLYESLLKDRPKDGGLHFRFGYTLYLKSLASGKDGPAERALRHQARAELKQAEESGLDQPLVQQLLRYIQENGSVAGHLYSRDIAANEAMLRGESAFHRRDFAAARAEYQKALGRDGRIADAALYIGDCYFLERKHADAQQWFERASLIDPTLEQAFRFWGDSLWQEGKLIPALEKYSEALVASPYTGLAWRTLSAQAKQIERMRQPTVATLPKGEVKRDGDKAATIVVGSDYTALDAAYLMARAQWASEEFPKQFPGETYRHSLAEETHALRILIEISTELRAKAIDDDAKLQKQLREMAPSLDALTKLRDAGLLEAFVLFRRADAGIAQDYPAYRAAHRDKLREFVRRYFVNLD